MLNKSFKLGLSLVLVFGLTSLCAASAFSFFGLFDSDSDRAEVKLLNIEACPVQIMSGIKEDIGTKLMKLKSIEHKYTARIKNTSDKTTQSVQLRWYREIPFQSYSTRKYIVNNTTQIEPGRTANVSFRLPFDFRGDSYYKVEVSKVQFQDESVWDPNATDPLVVADGIQKVQDRVDIDQIFEKSKEEQLEEIKQKIEERYGDVNGEPLESEDDDEFFDDEDDDTEDAEDLLEE